MGTTLDILRAKKGDCLVLTRGTVRVLIDGGDRGTYNQFLRSYLEDLEDTDGEDAPDIDLVIVSHVDSDHIAGIEDLFEDMDEARQEQRAPIVNVRQVWLNSFADAIAASGAETPKAAKAASVELAETFADIFPDLGHTSGAAVLASVGQGRRVRNNLIKLGIPVNRRFKNKLVLLGNRSRPWKKGGVTISVIGPTQRELDALRDEWAKQLPALLDKEAEDAVKEAAAGDLDRSVFNLASIVAIVEADGKRILLTGDARGDMIMDWLTQAGIPEDQWHFDVLKMPHHGSDKNVSPAFFQRVTADTYVFCGNGNHGNPEPATFEMLFDARGDNTVDIWLSYGADEIANHSKFDQDDRLRAALARARNVHAPTPTESVIRLELG